jgi:hypothetical protein
MDDIDVEEAENGAWDLVYMAQNTRVNLNSFRHLTGGSSGLLRFC